MSLPRVSTARTALCLLGLLGSAVACKDRPKGEDGAAPGASPTAAAGPSQSAPQGNAGPSEAKAPEPKPARHVLLITIDALRADMPWIGYPRPIAPKLTALAKQSVVYSHAYALSSYTSMSLAGLMSGRFPSELSRDGRTTSSFGPEVEMLAEVLSKKDFHTLGVHGHVYFLGDTGIAQGFQEWHVVPKITSLPARDGHIVDDKIADALIAGLAEHEKTRSKKRLLAWAHFMDPHYSYAAHDGVKYRGSAYDVDGGADADADTAPVPPGVPLSEIGQRLRNGYDAEVTFTDRQVGRVLDYLSSRPYYADTAVIVTADHGEAFGEHKSYFEHGYLLHEVTARVPLLIRAPGLAPRRIDTRRSHIDLARTLFDLVGLPPLKTMRGTSLLPEMRGQPAPERPVILDMPYTDQTPRRRAVIIDDTKIVVTETEEVPTLFDLKQDPTERTDLAAKNPELLGKMQARWKEQDRALPDFPAPRRSKRGY
ncbi:MAG TPA: sulfatase [Polyangiaceae bacterium]|nr:sulfatase [Polyangiaceae bacterium]